MVLPPLLCCIEPLALPAWVGVSIDRTRSTVADIERPNVRGSAAILRSRASSVLWGGPFFTIPPPFAIINLMPIWAAVLPSILGRSWFKQYLADLSAVIPVTEESIDEATASFMQQTAPNAEHCAPRGTILHPKKSISPLPSIDTTSGFWQTPPNTIRLSSISGSNQFNEFGKWKNYHHFRLLCQCHPPLPTINKIYPLYIKNTQKNTQNLGD